MTPKCMLNVCFLLICVGGSKMAQAQSKSWEAPADRLGRLEKRDVTTLYNENKVPDYVLPPLLVTSEGLPVRDGRQWATKRRPEILSLFERFMFGQSPIGPAPTSSFSVRETAGSALGGLAQREQVRFEFARGTERAGMDLLLYLPRKAKGPVPVFLILNFEGNHTISMDPLVERPQWPAGSDPGRVRSLKSERGDQVGRFSLAAILGRGYGLATVYYEQIGPDRGDAVSQGVRGLFNGRQSRDGWSSIGAWAWGLSRAMDYLVANPLVDSHRVIVTGHSRLGKTALWAGARDPRFAMVVSNCSGCGGAALSRRHYGETVKRINTSFPHWFCEKFKSFNDAEGTLPLDQHMLIALMAPRPVYVVSADEDLWADPRGEFLSCLAADPVYDLLGVPGLEAEAMPGLDSPLLKGRIGYHVRSGGHDLTEYDWQRVMDFADRHLEINRE